MRRYLIPFAMGLMLGLGTVPLWAGPAVSVPAPSAQHQIAIK